MPTYQYACIDCAHRFEEVQAFSDPSLTNCPVCDGKLRKIYGSVGVVFKGSGFYRNDSRVAKGKDGAPSESSSSDSRSGDSGSTASGTEKAAPAAAKTSESSSASNGKAAAPSGSSGSSGSSASSGASKAAAS